jgi:hypothetical protein
MNDRSMTKLLATPWEDVLARAALTGECAAVVQGNTEARLAIQLLEDAGFLTEAAKVMRCPSESVSGGPACALGTPHRPTSVRLMRRLSRPPRHGCGTRLMRAGGTHSITRSAPILAPPRPGPPSPRSGAAIQCRRWASRKRRPRHIWQARPPSVP